MRFPGDLVVFEAKRIFSESGLQLGGEICGGRGDHRHNLRRRLTIISAAREEKQCLRKYFEKVPTLSPSSPLPNYQYGHALSFPLLVMMLHQPDSPFKHNRPRSSSHPVRPQQVRRSSETSESAPVRPPRNPARPLTFGGGQRGPPPVAFKPTTASEDDHREREICDRASPSVNVVSVRLPYDDRVQIIIQ